MKVLIIEDEEVAYKSIVAMLNRIDESIKVIAWLRDIKSCKEWFSSDHAIDLIFLDIQLTDGQSFEIFESFEINTPIIFTTAYVEFAIKAFETNGVDYLVKPYSEKQLLKSLEKYKKYHTVQSNIAIKKLIAEIKTVQSNPEYKTRFLIKVGDKLNSVGISEISYFYRDDLVFMVTKTNKRYPVDYALEELVELLNPESFFRLNRQCIASIDSIIQVHKYFKGKLKVQLNPEEEFIVSQERSSEFKKWLNGYL